MKRTTTITLAMAIGIALFQPVSTFAKGQDDKEKGQGKKEKTHGKSGDKGSDRGQAFAQPRITAPVGPSKKSASRSQSVNTKPGTTAVARSYGSRSVPAQTVTAQSSTFAPSTSRDSQQSRYSGRGGSNSSYSNQSSYTRSNSYGGLWVHGDTHRDWDRNRVHSWNNRRYGWYDGGWLIIDAGFRPSDYSGYGYSGSNYSADSTVRQVQRRLNTKGYPVGYADGVIGPATRNGIGNYQRDSGLAVTGRINDPLLASLGLL